LGEEVTLVTTNDDGPSLLEVPLRMPVEKNGYITWYFPRQAGRYTVSLPMFKWLNDNISKYDCLHLHAVLSYSTTAAFHVLRKRRIPYVLEPHGILMEWGLRSRHEFLKRISIELIEKRIMRKAACVIFTSEKEKLETIQIIKDIYHIIIPNGIDLSDYKNLSSKGWLDTKCPVAGGRVKLLALSRISEVKGLDTLLKACGKLEADTYCLFIAGEGDKDYKQKLRDEANELGLEPVWLGFIWDKEKRLALADADIFVQASWSESFGMSVVEALACGTPVVITDRIGVCDDVRRANAGMVVPPYPEGIAGALKALIDDKELRNNMGWAGVELVREKYDYEKVAISLQDLYESIVRKELVDGESPHIGYRTDLQ
jgi:glycosyltransferase involved in cell wall biosynthesis